MKDCYINLYSVRNNRPYQQPDSVQISGVSYGIPFPCKDDQSAVKATIESLQQQKITFNPKDFDLCIVGRFYPFAKKPVSNSIGKPKVICNVGDILGELYKNGGDSGDA